MIYNNKFEIIKKKEFHYLNLEYLLKLPSVELNLLAFPSTLSISSSNYCSVSDRLVLSDFIND